LVSLALCGCLLVAECLGSACLFLDLIHSPHCKISKSIVLTSNNVNDFVFITVLDIIT
ncbi:unnamed protein product, partial [Prunus brigantina]